MAKICTDPTLYMPFGGKYEIVTFLNVKRSNKRYGKLPVKLFEEMPQNKICVDLIVTHVIRREGKK